MANGSVTGFFPRLAPPQAAVNMATGAKAKGKPDSGRGAISKAQGGTGNSMEVGGGRSKSEIPATGMGA